MAQMNLYTLDQTPNLAQWQMVTAPCALTILVVKRKYLKTSVFWYIASISMTCIVTTARDNLKDLANLAGGTGRAVSLAQTINGLCNRAEQEVCSITCLCQLKVL